MAFFSAASGVVALRYTANIEDAKAKVRELSGEQKKAAQAQVKALEDQAKAYDDFGKRSAVALGAIGATVAIAADGWKAYKEDARLAAGAAGVDIDKLSEAYDGLKTRTELMTLAQAGHQGAWKLTTNQIALVVDGMRALEKKGFEADVVFQKFTDNLKKGTLEGFDDLGLSIKSTGDKTKDLQILMRELGQQVADVGGDFAKAGDDAQRSLVKMEDGLNRVRVAAGKATNVVLDLAAAAGRGLGAAIFGPLETAGNNELAQRDYRAAFGALRSGGAGASIAFNSVGNGFGGLGTFTVSRAGRSAADAAQIESDARALDAFRRNLRRLRTSTELNEAIGRLPADWRSAAPEFAEYVDSYAKTVQDATLDTAKSSLITVRTAFLGELEKSRKAANSNRARGGGGGRSRGEETSFLDPYLDDIQRIYAGVMASYEEGQARSRSNQIRGVGGRIANDLDDAKRALLELQATLEETRAREQSFLAAAFGELWEFDAYTEALNTVGTAAQNLSNGLFASFVEGEELTAKAIRRMIGMEIGAEAKRLWARGTSGLLTGIFHVATGDPRGPGMVAAAGAMIAGAGTLGALARSMTGGGDSTPAGAAAGGGGRQAPNTDAGGGASNGNGGTPPLIVIGPAFDDESTRQRARTVTRSLQRAASVYPRAAGVGQ